jgi:hypothetical protein
MQENPEITGALRDETVKHTHLAHCPFLIPFGLFDIAKEVLHV